MYAYINDNFVLTTTCTKCKGNGWVFWNELDFYDDYAKDPSDCYIDDTKYPCYICNGLGKIPKTCNVCNGNDLDASCPYDIEEKKGCLKTDRKQLENLIKKIENEHEIHIKRKDRKIEKRDRKIKALEEELTKVKLSLVFQNEIIKDLKKYCRSAIQDVLSNLRFVPIIGLGSNDRIVEIKDVKQK